MHDCALLRGELPQRRGQLGSKSCFIRLRRCRQGLSLSEFLVVLFASATPANEVNGRIMREPDEKCPLIPRAAHQIRTTRQPDKNLLQKIPSILLVPGKIQQKREQSLGVVVVESLDSKSAGIVAYQ